MGTHLDTKLPSEDSSHQQLPIKLLNNHQKGILSYFLDLILSNRLISGLDDRMGTVQTFIDGLKIAHISNNFGKHVQSKTF